MSDDLVIYLGGTRPTREPGIYYHATRAEDVPSLLATGADASRIGINAGSVVGVGFYASYLYWDAEFWAYKLFNCATTILQVRLPLARIATTEQQIALNPILDTWGREHGYIVDDEPTEKLLHAHHVTQDQRETNHIQALGLSQTLRGLLLSERGYDGYEVEDGVVITNFTLLTGAVFSLAVPPPS